MKIPDHYKILELEPSADLADIKKAYRRLAQRYHPDKTNNDPYAREYFNAIKDAYDVLTSPSKKEKYLQQRWFRQTAGRRTAKEIITPVTILKASLELDKYVSTLDIHRMDKQGLSTYIHELLSDEHIEKLNKFDERVINEEFTYAVLRSSSVLPYPMQIRIHDRLQKIINTPTGSASFQKQIRIRRKNHQWDKYRIAIILVTVVMLMLLIFFGA